MTRFNFVIIDLDFFPVQWIRHDDVHAQEGGRLHKEISCPEYADCAKRSDPFVSTLKKGTISPLYRYLYIILREETRPPLNVFDSLLSHPNSGCRYFLINALFLAVVPNCAMPNRSDCIMSFQCQSSHKILFV